MSARLLFVSSSADWSGPTSSLFLLLQHLRLRNQVAVLLPGRGEFSERLAEEAIRVFSFPSLTKRSLPAIMLLARRERVDLVYANNARSPSRLAFIAARGSGALFVCHIRGMEWKGSWLKLGYLSRADAVVAVSNACAESVRRFVPPERLHVVYNGVPSYENRERTAPNGRGIRARLGLDERAFVLLSVSHVCKRKGQERAIEAMSVIHDRMPDAHLCLAGGLTRDRGYVRRLQRTVEGNGLASHVHFLGYQDDVHDLLRDADLLVHTASADPHPRSVLEAMACGLPVVAFAVDGVAETVVDGVTGRLVEPGDSGALCEAVLELAARPKDRLKMGERARVRARNKFSDGATAVGVQRVINHVFAVKRRVHGSTR